MAQCDGGREGGRGEYNHAALIRGNLEGIVEERACEASFA